MTVTNEGVGQVVTGSAVDLAGNLTTANITVNLDKTPPEAFLQFDPVSKDVFLFGRDPLSGVVPGPVSPISVQHVRNDDADKNDDRHSRDGGDPQAAIRTYKVFDLAGNSLLLVEKVRKHEDQLRVTILTLQYNDGPVVTPQRNEETFEWKEARDGSMRELQQEFKVGPGDEGPRVEAEFEAHENETIIRQEEPEPKTKVVKPGLALLRLATAGGKLAIEF